LVSIVARIATEPAATAVTNPDVDTVATAGFTEDQLTVRPVSTAPPASSATALACVVCPTVSAYVAKEAVTVATGAGATGAAATVSDFSPV
jgi:hypothetical protein